MKRYIKSAIQSIEDLDWRSKYEIIQSPSASPAMLHKYAKSEDINMVEEVARHPNTPVEDLRELYEKGPKGINVYLAQNPNIPIDILEKLAKDTNVRVRWLVVHNPRVTDTILEQLADDSDVDVVIELARCVTTPEHLLRKLAGSFNEVVRKFVASNENTPTDVLRMLTKDGHWEVEERAWQNLEYRGEA